MKGIEKQPPPPPPPPFLSFYEGHFVFMFVAEKGKMMLPIMLYFKGGRGRGEGGPEKSYLLDLFRNCF